MTEITADKRNDETDAPLIARDRNGAPVDHARIFVPQGTDRTLYFGPADTYQPTHALVPLDEYRQLRETDVRDRVADGLSAEGGRTDHERSIGVGAMPGSGRDDAALEAQFHAEFAGGS